VLAAVGARTLRAAHPDLVNRITDFAAPLVCPVLLPESMVVLADSCVGHADVIYAPTGDGGTALGISSRWLLTSSRASVAELCSPQSPTVDLADDVPGSTHLDARMPGRISNRMPHVR
jgi:prolyl-tRNA editing enzyme YbaK/EbsC (Cys-tRNA(Pro) deacylase)